MKKKFLANLVVLSMCASTILNNTYALWPDCNKLNKNGQFDDETCAIVDSVDKISNGEKFIKLENVGRKSEFDLLFFDSIEINRVLSNLTYNKDITQLVAMQEYQVEKENEAISDKIYTFGIGGTSANILKNTFKALNLKREDGKRLLQNPLGELNLLRHRIQNVAVIVPLAIATGISTLVAGLARVVNSYFSNKEINTFLKKSNVEKINYFGTLRILLDYINREKLNINKILCLRVKSLPTIVRVLDKKVNQDIGIEEQREFNDNVKKLKEEIISILTEANELESTNV